LRRFDEESTLASPKVEDSILFLARRGRQQFPSTVWAAIINSFCRLQKGNSGARSCLMPETISAMCGERPNDVAEFSPWSFNL
jgi:hypothetical protein